MKLDLDKIGVSRSRIIEALELRFKRFDWRLYQYTPIANVSKKIAYGSSGFPWNSDICKRDISYEKGICPVAETLKEKTFLGFEMCLHELSEDEIEATINVFKKIWSNLDSLKI